MHTLHPPSLNFPITPFAAPNDERTSPPHVPTRPRFLTIFPSIANADFKLMGGATYHCGEWSSRSWWTMVFSLLDDDDLVEGVVLLLSEGGAVPVPLDVS